jgi:hypothetical protein
VLHCGAMAYDGPAHQASAAVEQILATKVERDAYATSKPGLSNTRMLAVASEPCVASLRNGHAHE